MQKRHDQSTLDAIRQANPLADVLYRDYGLELKSDGAGRKKALCPFHHESRASFTIFEKNNSYYCFGCGEHGDLFTFAQKLTGLSFLQTVERYSRHADIPLHGVMATERNLMLTKPKETPKPELDFSMEWQVCTAAFTYKHLQKLAEWRGYSLAFCQWLRSRLLVGLFRGSIAFPVHATSGTVVGVHYRIKPTVDAERTPWFYYPKGCHVYPFVMGDLNRVAYLFVYESQWDLFSVADRMQLHTRSDEMVAFIATRGAANGRLIGGLAQPGSIILAFKQNDQAGERWMQDVVRFADVPVREVNLP